MLKIMIHHSSMIPIYEQISDQIKSLIKQEILKENDPLPSVRAFAKTYRISALTVKKAYDLLEEEGLIHTIHGKGSYVASITPNVVLEEAQKILEAEMEKWIEKARQLGFSKEEIKDMFYVLLEDL